MFFVQNLFCYAIIFQVIIFVYIKIGMLMSIFIPLFRKRSLENVYKIQIINIHLINIPQPQYPITL